MRIRKRKVRLPLSSLLPVPLSSLYLSDPHSISPSGASLLPPVQLLLRSAAPPAADVADEDSKPSDNSATNPAPINGPGSTNHTELVIKGEEKLATNFSSFGSPSKIGASAEIHPSSTSHRDEKWHAGDQKSSTLLNKRKRRDDDEEGVEGDEFKNPGININARTPNSEGIIIPSSPSSAIGAKKRGRVGAAGAGGTVMEGSRCSRVNGRGWRCCQPTLVGYSLCEHHLGKGRLRSVANVRGRGRQLMSPKPPAAKLHQPKDDDEEDEDYDVGYTEKKKKRTTRKLLGAGKLGVLKARSMSSLLGQQDRNYNSSSGAINLEAVEAHVGSDVVKECSDVEASMK